MNLLKFPKLGAVLIVGFSQPFGSCEMELTDPEVIKSVRYTGVTINAPEIHRNHRRRRRYRKSHYSRRGYQSRILEPGNAKIKIREKPK